MNKIKVPFYTGSTLDNPCIAQPWYNPIIKMGQQQSQSTPKPISVVLVGGGHANVQILKILSQKFIINAENLTLIMISDFPKAYYSGMLPGCISNFYKTEQIQIDLVALCEW